MLKDIKWPREIIISAIAGSIGTSIVTVFIQPILQGLGDLLVWASTYVYNGFFDFIYRNAALGFREQSSFIAMYLLCDMVNIPVLIICGLYATFYVEYRFKVKIFSLPEQAPENPKAYFSTLFFYVIIFALSNLIILFLITENFLEIKFIASFQQELAILSPKISDQDIKELKAQWASMKNFKDYAKIKFKVRNLAKEKHVELPPL